MADENDIVTRVGAHIEESAYTALDLLDTAKDKVFDLTDSVSGLSGIISGFISQTEKSNDQLAEMQRKHASLRQQLLLLTGVFSAATVATTKFVKSVFDTETSLRKMAKQQHKSVEAVRASDTALQSMGKTLKEVRADKELNATYKELVNINKEIQLPNIERGMDAVKGLQAQFWKLKDLAKYAIDSIGMRVLNQLEEPIKRITDRLGSVAKWLQNNLDSLTMKLSSGLSAFIKGVDGIARGVVGIIDKVNQIDPAIRKIGTAILAVFALLKSGPLGQIMALVTFIGGIIDDLDNYRYNKRYGLTAENPEGVDEKGRTVRYVETALTGVWDIFEDQGISTEEKIGSIFDLVLGKLTDKLDEAVETLSKIDIWGAIFGDGKSDGSLFGKLIAALDDENTQVQLFSFAQKLFQVFTEGFRIGGELVKSAAGLIIQIFDKDGALSKELDGKLKENNVATGIGSLIFSKILGVGNLEAIGIGITEMLDGAREKAEEALKDQKFDSQKAHDEAYNKKVLELLGVDLGDLGSILWEALRGALDTVGTFSKTGGSLAGGFVIDMLDRIFGDESSIKQAAQNVINSGFWDIFLTGGAVGAATGNKTAGLLGGLTAAIAKYTKPDGLKQLSDDFNSIKEAVLTLWFGSWDKVDADGNRVDGAKRMNNGLKSILEPLWKDFWDGAETGVLDENGNPIREGGLKDKFSGIGERIRKALIGDEGEPGKVVKLFSAILEAAKSYWNDTVLPWLDSIKTAVVEWATKAVDDLWIAIYNAMERSGILDKIIDVATLLGRQDLIPANPNKSTISQNDAGNYILKSTNGKEMEITPEVAAYLKGMEGSVYTDGTNIFARNGKYLPGLLNPDGTINYNSGIAPMKYDQDLANWRESQSKGPVGRHEDINNDKLSEAERQSLAREISDLLVNHGTEVEDGGVISYDIDDNVVDALRKKIEKYNSKFNGEFDLSDSGNLKIKNGSQTIEEFEAEASAASARIDSLAADVKENLADVEETATGVSKNIENMNPMMEIDGDASKAIESANQALREIKSKKGVIPLLFSFAGLTFGEPELYGSQGGRFNDPTDIQIGEDGPEYLIPINKPNRAANLIKQMFGEMGSATAKRVLDDLGIGAGQGFAGGSYSSLASLTGGNSSITTNNNVQAPVNIYVTASGVSAEDVGARAYDAAQRQMLRTLKGVFA